MDPVLIAGMGMAAFGILTGLSACLAFTGKRFARLMDQIESEGFLQRYVLYDKLLK